MLKLLSEVEKDITSSLGAYWGFWSNRDDATDAIVDVGKWFGIDAYLPVDFSDDKIYLFNPSMVLLILWNYSQFKKMSGIYSTKKFQKCVQN